MTSRETRVQRAELEKLWGNGFDSVDEEKLATALKSAEGGDTAALEEIWKQSMGDLGDQAAMSDLWRSMAGMGDEADMMNQAWMGDDFAMEELARCKERF